MARPLTDVLARDRRWARALGVPALGGAPAASRRRAARRPGDAQERDAAQRPDRVLLPVPAADGALLHRAVVPVGRPRALGDRHRCAAAPALGHAARRRGRHPEGVPARFAAARRAHSGSGCCSWASSSSSALLEEGAGAEVTTWPMLLAGLGVGALASQLGAVTVSSVPDEETGEVGGLQNTVTNLGASIGTALAGAVLIVILTSSFFSGIAEQPRRPRQGRDRGQHRAGDRRPVRVGRRPPAGARRARTCRRGRPRRSSRRTRKRASKGCAPHSRCSP